VPTTDEAAIQQLLDELIGAWNRGDARAYAARCLADATFTDVNGTFHESRAAFSRRQEEIFRGALKGTRITLTQGKVRFIRPDVAVIDTECGLFGYAGEPPGVAAGADGALHTRLLLVMVKESGSWWIAAYHNVWRAAAR
jgi:uncharacterized protein (TIGR02246 family)